VNLLRLSIDFENPAEQWWECGGRDLWESLAEEADASAVVVEDSIARSWLTQAAAIPGWDDGPEYAPHPVCTSDVADDEDV
jgi:hypothetical protein